MRDELFRQIDQIDMPAMNERKRNLGEKLNRLQAQADKCEANNKKID